MSGNIEGFEDDKIEEVGAQFLEVFVNRLYTKPQHVIREYVSNAVDALASKVEISCIAPLYNELIIRDDGIGFKNLAELKKALRLMISQRLDDDRVRRKPPIGYFGIGFYSGGLLCEEIEIRSTSRDSDNYVIAKIPIGDWLREIKGGEARYKKLTDVTNIKKKQIQNSKYSAQHHTSIILHGIKEDLKKIMVDEKKREKFIEDIGQIVPVGYDPSMSLVATEIIPDSPDELNIRDVTDEFREWQKEILENQMTHEGKMFSCQYNNINLFFNGKQLFRPIPLSNAEEDPLDSKKAWLSEKFMITHENGDEELVGIGWAIMRGSRLKKSRTSDIPIEYSGSYKKESLRGIQIRLYNVEIVPFPKIWTKFDIKLQSQPVGHIWGELYLFSDEIKIDPKRGDLIERGITKEVLKKIEAWVIKLLRFQEERRHSKTYWRNILDTYQKSLEIKDDVYNILSNIRLSYKSNPDSAKMQIITFKEELIDFKKKLTKHKKDIDKNYTKIQNLPEVLDYLDNLKQSFENLLKNLPKRANEILKAIEDRIDEREKIAKSKETPEPVGITTAEPVSTTSVEPVGTTIAEPVSTITAEPVGTTTAEPVSTTSVEPVGTTTAEPVSTITAEPVGTTTPEPTRVMVREAETEKQDEWSEFKEIVFLSYELNTLDEALLKEIFRIADMYIKNIDDKLDLVDRISLVLNEHKND